jgi:hypothetical protein
MSTSLPAPTKDKVAPVIAGSMGALTTTRKDSAHSADRSNCELDQRRAFRY